MSTISLWDFDHLECADLLDDGIPAWIEAGISPADVAAIVQGGCASGAYMPAVTYCKALETMGEHGDDVLQYIEDALGEIPAPRSGESWSGLAVFYLSYAVELWAGAVEQDLETAIEEMPKFSTGWNMCGYLPDSDPAEFAEFETARAYVVLELEERAEQMREDAEQLLDGSLEGADARQALLEKASELEQAAQYASEQESAFSVVVAGFAFWVAAL